ncbi:MAG TPA: choice-of-anchor D domain-containing protein, partial [Kofleriaceae bacterium]|nr:choice-of-anchor D domain-containing protein [Kofleriaceae bacterium]
MAVVLAAALAAATGASRAAGTASPSPLRADPEVGVVELAASGSGSGAITLHNDGSAAINVTAVTPTPGCDPAVHVSPAGPFSIAAGGSRTLQVSCTPAPAGMQRCVFQAQATGIVTELEAVCAYGNTPGITPDTSAIDFGMVAVGGAEPRTVVLHNTAAALFDHVFVETTDLAGNFSVAAPCNPDGRECNAQVTAIPAGGTLELSVACTPRSPGPHAAQLFLVTDAGTRLTAPISLTCTGTAAAVPVLSVAPTIVDVGAVEVLDAMASATVHISNAGADQL